MRGKTYILQSEAEYVQEYCEMTQRIITPEYFAKHAGWADTQDDLERVNCSKAGETGHQSCGWCEWCKKPVFSCGHYLLSQDEIGKIVRAWAIIGASLEKHGVDFGVDEDYYE